MARCDQGYICEVCGEDVEVITDSDLYLRYILGEVAPETLTHSRERHIRCNPVLAQFINDEQFTPIIIDNAFDKRKLDPQFVQEEEARVTRGWRRLQEIPKLRIPVTEYPFPDVKAKWVISDKN